MKTNDSIELFLKNIDIANCFKIMYLFFGNYSNLYIDIIYVKINFYRLHFITRFYCNIT